jgi:hypothetical protein
MDAKEALPRGEVEHYALVAKFLKRRFACFATAINCGTKQGRVDVVGVRDIGGLLTGAFELVAVEVKAGREPFATATGQAYGYSVYADRCYLADCRETRPPFSLEEIDIAAALGVGLPSIRGGNRVSRGIGITQVLASPKQRPIERLRSLLLYRVGYARCQICGCAFAHGGSSTIDEQLTRPYVKQAYSQELAFVYWLEEINARKRSSGRKHNHERRYLCRDCIQNLYDEGLAPH